MSRTEWRLWYRLRSRQLLGCKFRRQVPVGPYFADFACLEARLVLEVDGDHHGDQLVYDARRDHWLGEMGFRVLRFWVAEIVENIEGVIETIADALSPFGSEAPHLPPPAAAGEDESTQERLYYSGIGQLRRLEPPERVREVLAGGASLGKKRRFCRSSQRRISVQSGFVRPKGRVHPGRYTVSAPKTVIGFTTWLSPQRLSFVLKQPGGVLEGEACLPLPVAHGSGR
ncbi:MAG: endonuclease domain-containing protein [Candidatus Dormibacter sp.]